MAKLPEMNQFDKTLKEAEKAFEAQGKLKPSGHALGAGEIGKECRRELFYKFRTVDKKDFDAKTLFIFESGHRAEDVVAEKLRLLPYIELYTVDPERVEDPNAHNKQIGIQAHLGHFKAYLDGMIKGIVEAPQTWHTWENKCVEKDKFEKFKQLRDKYGNKNTVENWNYVYHCQTVIGMYLMKQTRCFFTVSLPGVRDWTSCRVAEDKKLGESLFQKAHGVIFDNFNIPAKFSQNPESYGCKYCDYNDICHHGKIPLVHCKTCRYIKCTQNGQWQCMKTDKIISKHELLLNNCDNHIFNHVFLPDDFTFLEHEKSCMVFKTAGKMIIANCDKIGFPENRNVDEILTSNDLFEKIKNWKSLSKDFVQKVVDTFNGNIVSENEYKSGIKGL